MNNQPQQHFCTNCGQSLPPRTAFCVACGAPVNPPPVGAGGGSPYAGAPAGYVPQYAQAPVQDDPVLNGLAAGYIANRLGRFSRRRVRRSRRPGARLRGCGCLFLILIVIAGLYIGMTYTTGGPHVLLTYAIGTLAVLFVLLLLIGMLATRGGREALAEGCLEAIFNGFLGKG